MIKISPSILSADFSKLGNEVKKLEKATADMIHIDIMDGHFVHNLTIGPVVIKSIRKHTNLPFDVHLMISNPEKYIQNFVEAGADIITIHYESTTNLKDCLTEIKSFNKLAGISIKPQTSPEVLKNFLEQIDLILIMTVEPGFAGQKFQHNLLEKIKLITSMVNSSNKPIMISVDGGINDVTGKLCRELGVNILVAGNFIFKAKNWHTQIKKLRG